MIIDLHRATKVAPISCAGVSTGIVLRGNESAVLGDLGVDLMDIAVFAEVGRTYERIRHALDQHGDLPRGHNKRLRSFADLLQLGPSPEAAITSDGGDGG